MKSFSISIASCVVAVGANAATIMSVPEATGFPTPGDYASDAIQSTSGSQFQFATTRDEMGQSFTLGSIGDDAYLFNSITFQIQDRGQTDEPATGITLGVYTGGSVDANDLLASFTFGAGTFDTSNGNFVTFELSPTESDMVGLLSAGIEYTAAFTTSNAAHDFRFRRNTNGAYAGGNAFWDDRVLDGNPDSNLDFVFQVNVTAVPEPSAIALLALGSFGLASRRRRS